MREGDERGFLNVRVELEDGFEPEDTRVERDDSESKDSLLKKKTKENMSSKPNKKNSLQRKLNLTVNRH